MDRQRWLVIALVFGCFGGLFLICFGECSSERRPVWLSRCGAVLLSALPARPDRMGTGPVAAALGAGGECGHAAPGQPDRGGALSRQADLRPSSLSLGGSALHRRPCLSWLSGRCSRSCGLGSSSWVGAGLAALTYTFGAPVLFQYCNIIYLVGAAWLPLGFLAIDRWIRLRQPAWRCWVWQSFWPCKHWAATRSRPIFWGCAGVVTPCS